MGGAHGDGDRAGGCPPSPLCLPSPHSMGTPVGTAAVSVHGSRDFRRPNCSEVVQTQLSDDAAAHSLHSKNPHIFQHFQTEMVRLGKTLHLSFLTMLTALLYICAQRGSPAVQWLLGMLSDVFCAHSNARSPRCRALSATATPTSTRRPCLAGECISCVLQ